MAIDYKKCPSCGAKNGVKIVYGKPTQELVELAEKRKVHLGGCEVKPNHPEFHCLACSHKWTKKQAVRAAYNEIQQVHFTIGGFSQGHMEFKIDLVNGRVHVKNSFEEDEKISSIKELAEARARLRRTNVLEWKAKYVHPDILDGEQWSLELVTEMRTIRKHGSNKYPRDWGLFCYWVDTLLKKKLFKDRYNEQKAKFEIDFELDLS